MDPATEASLRELVRGRLQKQAPEIARSLQQIAAGNPLGSEPREERLVARIATKANLSRRDAQAVADAVAQKATRIVGGLKGAIAAGHERKESVMVTRRKFSREFKRVYGMTPTEEAEQTRARLRASNSFRPLLQKIAKFDGKSGNTLLGASSNNAQGSSHCLSETHLCRSSA